MPGRWFFILIASCIFVCILEWPWISLAVFVGCCTVYLGLILLLVILEERIAKRAAAETAAAEAAAAARTGSPTTTGRHLDYRPPVGRERKRLRKQRAASQVQSQV
jgi:hypothetical protein